MKIAVPYEEGKVFQHFGHCEQFRIYDAEGGKIVKAETCPTNGAGHGALAAFLQARGVEALLCGGIGGGAIAALKEAGIAVYRAMRMRAPKNFWQAPLPTIRMQNARIMKRKGTTAGRMNIIAALPRRAVAALTAADAERFIKGK